jgi:hypothetical protein
MSSSSSSKPISKKRKLSKVRSGPNVEREQQISDFWNKNVEPAECSSVRTKTGRVYSYPAMATSADRSAVPPPVGAPEEIWEAEGWTLKIETGKTCALKFPVGSSEMNKNDWLSLPVLERERCVPADTAFPAYRCCPRNLVDKVDEDGGVLENFYLAGAARWAKKGEAPNCRLTLDPDNPEECVLISTLKTQSNTEWKLDRDYAHRMLSMGDYEYGTGCLHSDEESEASDVVATVGVARARRSVTVAEKLDREEETSVYQAQELSYSEGAVKDRAACLAELEVARVIRQRSLNVATRGVFDPIRLVSIGKAICKHFDIALDEDTFPVVPDVEDVEEAKEIL